MHPECLKLPFSLFTNENNPNKIAFQIKEKYLNPKLTKKTIFVRRVRRNTIHKCKETGKCGQALWNVKI